MSGSTPWPSMIHWPSTLASADVGTLTLPPSISGTPPLIPTTPPHDRSQPRRSHVGNVNVSHFSAAELGDAPLIGEHHVEVAEVGLAGDRTIRHLTRCAARRRAE